MIDLLEADNSKLKRRVYNITGMSFSAGEIASEIKKYIPEFKIEYKPDFRQEIADSWPRTIDDSLARQEWGWNPTYDLSSMVKDVIKILKKRLGF
jgi:nucleoside-diphosphate-sugar epimerase